MGDRGVHFVSHYISMLKDIDTLKLNNCEVTDDGIAILCRELCQIKVEKLFLNENFITMRGLKNL